MTTTVESAETARTTHTGTTDPESLGHCTTIETPRYDGVMEKNWIPGKDDEYFWYSTRKYPANAEAVVQLGATRASSLFAPSPGPASRTGTSPAPLATMTSRSASPPAPSPASRALWSRRWPGSRATE